MKKPVTTLFLLATFSLLSLHAVAQPVIYYCNVFTRLPGTPESPVFRFEVEGAKAMLTYTHQIRPTEKPQDFEIPLDVLNNSNRSLVLGTLTEGDEEHAPRYDVWVLDKNNMHMSSETTRSTDANIGRLEQRSGTCIIAD